jgi:hypothetical protein
MVGRRRCYTDAATVAWNGGRYIRRGCTRVGSEDELINRALGMAVNAEKDAYWEGLLHGLIFGIFLTAVVGGWVMWCR